MNKTTWYLGNTFLCTSQCCCCAPILPQLIFSLLLLTGRCQGKGNEIDSDLFVCLILLPENIISGIVIVPAWSGGVMLTMFVGMLTQNRDRSINRGENQSGTDISR